MLILGAEIEGAAGLDVRIEAGWIVEVGPRLARDRGEEVLDAAGGALLPGLHDHHVHLFAMAAADASAACGPPLVGDRAALQRALGAATRLEGWVRGVGYHESVAGDLDRAALDALAPEGPARVQHRSGALWMVNSAGVARLGLDAGADTPGVERDAAGRATGRIYAADGWLRGRWGALEPPSLAGVGARLAACGVTGVTDATPSNAADALARLESAAKEGELPQRVLLMGSPELPPPSHPRFARGPVKLMLAERDPPDFDALVDQIRAAHAQGRAVAIHCVTRVELVLAVAALRAAGARAGDRIEHASVAPPGVVGEVARLPITVVTQPNFLCERGDAYRIDVASEDLPWLYRCRGWLDAGVPLGAGTDAPFGVADPWLAMRTAVDRKTAAGHSLAAGEALTPERALALFTSAPEAPGGPPRRVAPGAAADLCLLDVPWSAAREALSSARVAATLCAGAVHWRRSSAASRPLPM